MSGFFITFEGGEGAGKSTQVRRLAETLRAAGIDVVTTREPGGTPGADAIREIVLSGGAKRMGPQMEAVLFAAARKDHVDHLIRPALQRGATVICDRFLDSTRVYQATGDAEDDAFLRRLEKAALRGLSPDMTILLDVPAALGAERAGARREGAAADRFESEDVLIHETRRARFVAIAEEEAERCVILDGSEPPDAVAAAVEAAVRARHPDLAAAGAQANEDTSVRASEDTSRIESP